MFSTTSGSRASVISDSDSCMRDSPWPVEPVAAIVPVAAGVPYEIPLGLQQPGDLLEAIADLHVIDGGPVDVALVT